MNLQMDFYGYDSFQGLPESKIDIHKNWAPGNYACSKEQVEMSFAKWGMPKAYFLHKGWYSKEFFDSLPKPSAPSIVVIDCDIYESAAAA